MATMEQIEQILPITDKPQHLFHAEASALSGHLRQPVKREIEKQASVLLKGDRRGGHFFQRAEHYSLEGLITFKSGYTHVSGNRSLKHNGFVTLSTSVLEGLNVLDVITADRMVAQVSTNHPLKDGHVPHVTFLGTQFANLRVGGYPVELELDFGICGQKPKGNRLYTEDRDFLDRARGQSASIASTPGLPTAVQEQYDDELRIIDELKELSNAGQSNGSGRGECPKVTCSLVKSIGPIPIPGVRSFGNVLEIPDFGTVALAEVEVGDRVYESFPRPSNYFELTMVKMKLGCIGHGNVNGAIVNANGAHKP